MELIVSRTTVFAIIAGLLLVLKLTKSRRKTAEAPGIGYGSLPFLGPWLGAFTFMKDPEDTINKAVAQYKGGYFRMASHALEYVIVADKNKIAEYMSAPEDHLSFQDQLNEFLQVEWTLGYGVAARPYHIGLIRTKLTQSIGSSVPSMLSEIQESAKSLLGSPKDWTEFKIYEVMLKTIARVSNNAFSGYHFCRNEEYLDVAIDYAQSVVISAEILRLVPFFLKPIVARLTPFRRIQKRAREMMGPFVQERLDANWEGKEKPKDMIQFIIDSAPDIERTMPQIVERMMSLNMASIHTTTMTITSAICLLAKEPEKYVPELRAELEQHCVDGKLDKMSIGKLVKLDSFLRECGRVEPLGNISSVRYVRKDFTFSDGMIAPAGYTLAAPIMMLHNEASDMTGLEEFDGFRYSRRNEESTGPTKHQMVNTDPNYVLFGHGKHACPGRFLAVTEMKLIFAVLLLGYDLKLVPGTKPKIIYFGTSRIPDTQYSILIKAR